MRENLLLLQLLQKVESALRFKNPSDEHLNSTLEKMGLILSNHNLREVARHFLYNKSATARILGERLEGKVPKRSLYCALDKLESLGLIRVVTWVRNGRSKRGPGARVYATPSATEEDVRRAVVLHKRLGSPLYRRAERVVQTILEDYLPFRNGRLRGVAPELQLTISVYEIVQITILRGGRESAGNILQLAETLLREQGFEVLRYGDMSRISTIESIMDSWLRRAKGG